MLNCKYFKKSFSIKNVCTKCIKSNSKLFLTTRRLIVSHFAMVYGLLLFVLAFRFLPVYLTLKVKKNFKALKYYYYIEILTYKNNNNTFSQQLAKLYCFGTFYQNFGTFYREKEIPGKK